MGLQIFKQPITQRKFYVRVYQYSKHYGNILRMETTHSNYEDAIEKVKQLEGMPRWLKKDEIVLIEEVKHLQQLDWKGEKP